MPHGHVTERVENTFIRDHAVRACEQFASFIEFDGHDRLLSKIFSVLSCLAAGRQSFLANLEPLEEKPGATVQPVSVQRPRLSAACQARAGTITCGTSPEWMSAPRRTISSFAPSTNSSLSGAPA